MQRVLVVDDEPEVLEKIAKYLHDDYHILTAQDARTALSLFDQEMPSVVITDITMPGMDGMELVKRIKEKQWYTEIIMVTGRTDVEPESDAEFCHGEDCLMKPVDPDALEMAIERALEKVAQHTQTLSEGMGGQKKRE